MFSTLRAEMNEKLLQQRITNVKMIIETYEKTDNHHRLMDNKSFKSEVRSIRLEYLKDVLSTEEESVRYRASIYEASVDLPEHNYEEKVLKDIGELSKKLDKLFKEETYSNSIFDKYCELLLKYPMLFKYPHNQVLSKELIKEKYWVNLFENHGSDIL